MTETGVTDMREVVLRVLGDIAPEIDLNSIDADANLRDQIDIDSVDFLNFVIGLHKALAIEIPDADLPKLATLNNWTAYLASKTGKT
jgi:acyl carrier protein